MAVLQIILVYITLALAIVYLLKKFILPKRLFGIKKTSKEGCGQEDCGCH
jgi:hypothetical protein